MKAHLPWITSYVDCGADTDDIAERLTIAGIEINSIDRFGAAHPGAVVGVVRENGEVEKSDHLRLLQIDAGLEKLVQVVTGAPNAVDFVDGTCVALALPGTSLVSPQGPSGGTWFVKKTKLMSIPSEGVLCSEMELGVSEDNEGVWMLDSHPAGTPLRDIVSLDGNAVAGDTLDVEILPNIARCQSVKGLVAELAAIYDVPMTFEPALADLDISSGPLDPDVVPECKRFAVAVLEGVEIKSSPWWIQARLLANGITPKNNVVDASNYVMLEIGQPTHAYDADKLTSNKLGCRFAKEGESFLPLGQGDEPKPISLPSSVLVITNDDKVVSAAGVIGGAESAVSETTTKVVLESANFDYLTIRKGQRLIDTFTDASARFGRGVDPTLPPVGIQRLVEILKETCPNLEVVETAESGQTEFPERTLPLDVETANRALGTHLDLARIKTLLERVGFSVDGAADDLTVTIPNARLDVAIEEDLFEEIARLDGYDRLPETIPSEPVPKYPGNPHMEAREDIEDFLAGQGLQQVMSYSLTSRELESTIELSPTEKEYIELMNPMTVDKAVMRRSLLPRLVQIMQENRRAVPYTHLFEQGIVVHPEGEGISPGLPSEPWRLAFALSGPVEQYAPHSGERDLDFFDGKRVLENLFDHLRVNATFVPAEQSGPHHPGVCASVLIDGKSVGTFGELHPKLAISLELDEGPKVYLGEFDLDAIIEHATNDFVLTPPARMPGIQIDISLLLDRALLAGDIVSAIESASTGTLETVDIFDRYTGEHVDEDKMALGVRLGFRAADRTLKMDEATDARDAIVSVLKNQFGAELR